LDENRINETVSRKLVVAKENIASEISRGIFPIVGYSYYEYANSLKQTDAYSAMLYAEYALELSNLEIYFKTKAKRFEIKKEWIIFVLGAVFGSSLTLLILMSRIVKKPEKTSIEKTSIVVKTKKTSIKKPLKNIFRRKK